jgi:multimeric flavodoxin WrbA
LAAKRLLIVYFSGEGTTRRMAEEICKGAERSEVQVQVKSVENCKLDDLVEANGIVVGSPTYFSNVAWQLKKLIDESIELYRKDHVLKDKVGGCFTSAGTRRDGKDCIRRLEVAFGFHHRMKLLPGVIRVSDDEETQVSKMCRQYGEEIARQILS